MDSIITSTDEYCDGCGWHKTECDCKVSVGSVWSAAAFDYWWDTSQRQFHCAQMTDRQIAEAAALWAWEVATQNDKISDDAATAAGMKTDERGGVRPESIG